MTQNQNYFIAPYWFEGFSADVQNLGDELLLELRYLIEQQEVSSWEDFQNSSGGTSFFLTRGDVDQRLLQQAFTEIVNELQILKVFE